MAKSPTLHDLYGASGSAASEDEEPFEPLSDEELRRVLDETDRRYGKQPSTAELKRRARESQMPYEEAYRAGQRDARASRRAGGAGAKGHKVASTSYEGLKGLLSGRGGGTVAGTFLGLALAGLAVNVLRFGPAGAKDWLSAKFVNKVTASASGAPANPSKPAKGQVAT